MPATVLIVDDEKHTREGLQLALEEDHDVYLASNAEEAFNLLEAETFDVVLTDLRMAGKSGMSVIDKAIGLPNQPIVIMMTAYGNVETAVEAMKRGAHEFLTKPVHLDKLELVIKRLLHSRQLEAENSDLHTRLDQKFSFQGFVGGSKALEVVIEKIKLVAPSKATILLLGETGTGKELAAQAIHQNSNRGRSPFVAVHCASLNPNLLESELFGHEKGAYTGAGEKRIGRFEAAHGGTLFLDEIGEIDHSTQVKLLRFLETRTFERLGSVEPITIDIRLVVATNKDLEGMVKSGDFREDLFYRLNVVSITMPPLRQRREDIPLLIDHFIGFFSKENEIGKVALDPAALSILTGYTWPGNIREVRNFAENIVVLKRGGRVTEYDLDSKFLAREDGGPVAIPAGGSLSMEENEKRLFRNALVESGGESNKCSPASGHQPTNTSS